MLIHVTYNNYVYNAIYAAMFLLSNMYVNMNV